MRATRVFQLYSIFVLSLLTFTSAWPWPRWLPELEALVVRADSTASGSTTPKATQTPSPSATDSNTDSNTDKTSDATSDSTSGSQTSKQTGSQTGKQTGSTTGKTTGKSSTTKKPTSTSYDARLPAGGVAMITPAVIDGSQYYKIGDFVTFAWNYTSLSATPSAVNILASCKQNDQLYTIAANQTIGNATGAVTWDTGAYQSTALSAPLLTETYTLIIYDAASSITAQAQAGYLAVFDSYTFGMYSPQAYTPRNEYQCVTCSSALGDMEKRAIGMVLGVSAVTVLSFTWFVGGAGVIW